MLALPGQLAPRMAKPMLSATVPSNRKLSRITTPSFSRYSRNFSECTSWPSRCTCKLGMVEDHDQDLADSVGSGKDRSTVDEHVQHSHGADDGCHRTHEHEPRGLWAKPAQLSAHIDHRLVGEGRDCGRTSFYTWNSRWSFNGPVARVPRGSTGLEFARGLTFTWWSVPTGPLPAQ